MDKFCLINFLTIVKMQKWELWSLATSKFLYINLKFNDFFRILPDARALVYCAGMYKNHRSTIFMKKYKYDIEKASIVYPYLSDEIKLVKSVIENCGY